MRGVSHGFAISTAMALLLAACGGQEATPALTPTPTVTAGTIVSGASGGTFRSDDGKLALEFPPGALSADTAIEIRRLSEAEAPPNPFERPWMGPVYALEPDGLQFEQPVTVSMSLRADELPAAEEEGQYPLVVPLTTGPDGNMEPVDQVQVVYGDDGGLILTTQLSHFSQLALDEGTGYALLLPPSVGPLPVPTEFSILASLFWKTFPDYFDFPDGSATEFPAPASVGFTYEADGIVVTTLVTSALQYPLDRNPEDYVFVFEDIHTFRCESEGLGTYSVKFEAAAFAPGPARAPFPTLYTATLTRPALCVESGEIPEPLPTASPSEPSPDQAATSTPTPPSRPAATPTPSPTVTPTPEPTPTPTPDAKGGADLYEIAEALQDIRERIMEKRDVMIPGNEGSSDQTRDPIARDASLVFLHEPGGLDAFLQEYIDEINSLAREFFTENGGPYGERVTVQDTHTETVNRMIEVINGMDWTRGPLVRSHELSETKQAEVDFPYGSSTSIIMDTIRNELIPMARTSQSTFGSFSRIGASIGIYGSGASAYIYSPVWWTPFPRGSADRIKLFIAGLWKDASASQMAGGELLEGGEFIEHKVLIVAYGSRDMLYRDDSLLFGCQIGDFLSEEVGTTRRIVVEQLHYEIPLTPSGCDLSAEEGELYFKLFGFDDLAALDLFSHVEAGTFLSGDANMIGQHSASITIIGSFVTIKFKWQLGKLQPIGQPESTSFPFEIPYFPEPEDY